VNNLFDRRIANGLERPSATDVNLVASDAAYAQVELLRMLNRVRDGNWTEDGATTGVGVDPSAIFRGDSFMMTVNGGTITLRPGVAFFRDPANAGSDLEGIPGVNDRSVMRPVVLSNAMSISVPELPTSDPRIDLVCVKPGRVFSSLTNDFQQLNPATGTFGAGSVRKEFSYAVDGNYSVGSTATGLVAYVTGTAASSPVAPALPSGYTLIGYVYVPAATSSFTEAHLSDFRRLEHGPSGLPISIGFDYAGNSGGGIVSSTVRVHAPPGVKAVVYDVGDDAEVMIAVKSGDPRYQQLLVTGLVGFTQSTVNTFEGYQPQLTGAISDPSPIGSTNVARLADAAKTFPATMLCTTNFQYVWTFSVRTLRSIQIDPGGGGEYTLTDYEVADNTPARISLLLVAKGGA